ncbi:endonuclease/exonuclease/phosphatase family protein [Zobellia galactanivorans]|uniref:endonuclease/exonuclease/phosphatase family protein n=1 Tax=Zobellia galactanivorans (strain DSM 12802 / CCUG 47099 / CIP 106680 / NCIMB 13871 / Dsij) TaxID=63186 RepID=UPI001C077702|nr:endonuclease/exonuclease/phosphatase family protein [Zobellia galactanivorans]MBU3026121.1 endonuclease/exonuclease/phosphatase family protein [Zobellia galactanivorans]MDO6807403.1 endonuclease/exonuclease/phosphatase family protein [Zobellia galactanivorans]
MFRKIILFAVFFLSLTVVAQKSEIQLVSWNIQDFGKTKSSEELEQMAELVREYDILAIQEVVAGYGGAQAVAKLSDILNRKGAKWDYLISNPTNSPKYVTERYAFIWKTKHIKIKSRGKLIQALDSLIDREPFLVDFFIGDKKLSLINFHSRPYNKRPEAEIMALTHYISENFTNPTILAGDFNVNEAMSVFDTFKENGYRACISDTKTTLKRACNGYDYLNHPIDNMFYSKDILKTDSGVLDFIRICDNLEMARRLSDHLPVFLRFRLE